MSSFASRFFAPDTSDSESESEVDDQPIIRKPIHRQLSDSSDDEKTRRIVKSASTKRREEFYGLLKKLKNSLKIKDFEAILTEFDQLHRLVNKHKDEDIPGPVLRFIISLNDVIKTVWEDKNQKARLAKPKLKAISTLRQKIKKQEDELGEKVTHCRQNPNLYDSEFEDDDTVAESETQSRPKEGKSAGGSAFIKTEKTKEAAQKRERRIKAVKIAQAQGEVRALTKQSRELFAADEEITPDSFVAKMREVFKMRGKKVSDKTVSSLLYNLKRVAQAHNFGNGILVKLHLLLLSLQLDVFTSDSVIKIERWRTLMTNANELFSLLASEKSVQLRDNILEEQESFTTSPYVIMGNPVHVCFKMADELKKFMQMADPYSLDYLERMKEVVVFDSLVALLQQYVEHTCNVRQVCEVYLLRVEQLYYRLERPWLALLGAQLTDQPTEGLEGEGDGFAGLLDTFCEYLFKHGSDRVPVKAALYRVYHYAINNCYNEAKELFLMSRIHESVHHGDPQTQTLYNRVLVQLGLCAFRYGGFKEAHVALRDLQLSGRIRELLAQGTIIRVERSAKQEFLDRKQLLPFHMHINLELVECVYLVSVLAVEAAYSAAPTQELRANFCSRGLVNLVRTFERLVVQGPPESMRECVYAGFKALRVGNWRGCTTVLRSIKCWRLLVDYASVLEILELQLKKECLVAFIFANCRAYSRITLSYLVDAFQLSENDVKATINRMILRDSFPVRWNQDTTVLTVHHDTLPNSISYLSSVILDRLKQVSEQQQRVSEVVNSIKKIRSRSRSKSLAVETSTVS